jgi:hypothetical protein
LTSYYKQIILTNCCSDSQIGYKRNKSNIRQVFKIKVQKLIMREKYIPDNYDFEKFEFAGFFFFCGTSV